jgi:hypothetical protein
VECIHRRRRPAAAAPAGHDSTVRSGITAALASSSMLAADGGGADAANATVALTAHYERLTDASILEIGSGPSHVQVPHRLARSPHRQRQWTLLEVEPAT